MVGFYPAPRSRIRLESKLYQSRVLNRDDRTISRDVIGRAAFKAHASKKGLPAWRRFCCMWLDVLPFYQHSLATLLVVWSGVRLRSRFSIHELDNERLGMVWGQGRICLGRTCYGIRNGRHGARSFSDSAYLLANWLALGICHYRSSRFCVEHNCDTIHEGTP